MDVNMLRALLTAACFLLFLGIVFWAYSGSRRERFEDAARVPLQGDLDGAPDDAARRGSAR
jgi:cytochrome c oxidase cbb3-type subunit 4